RVSFQDDKPFTLALGFGATQGAAVGVAKAARNSDFEQAERDYSRGWDRYDRSLIRPWRLHSELQDAYFVSANVLKASEDKTFPGAIVASLASPWGQAISAGDPSNTYFGSYREVFARDLYEAWTGLLADGDIATARDTVEFLFDRQQLADGS